MLTILPWSSQKRFIVPTSADQEKIPFARVNHNKYMVTDRTAYIGTSNWSADYFTDTAGIGFVVEETCDQHIDDCVGHRNASSIRAQLESIFLRDWNSAYAVPQRSLVQQRETKSSWNPKRV